MSWRESAACLGRPLEMFFHEGRQSAELRALCLSCPVRRDCFDDVMASERGIPLTHRAGFYAGLSAAERHQIEHRQERPGFFGGRPWWAPVARPHVCATDGCRCKPPSMARGCDTYDASHPGDFRDVRVPTQPHTGLIDQEVA